uniref:Uncharacterized protein n=1 Tax=Coccidioides posadasii RMSCC 3488 TaxID=454284 RepID=A0A0J6FC87_COCPO|nr:hypothetical protein CPAG_04206 [Coccidioides posadasii RMSCC 3488]
MFGNLQKRHLVATFRCSFSRLDSSSSLLFHVLLRIEGVVLLKSLGPTKNKGPSPPVKMPNAFGRGWSTVGQERLAPSLVPVYQAISRFASSKAGQDFPLSPTPE